MKIRNGFISNSSSSSFIVRIKDDNLMGSMYDIDTKLLANKEDVKKLEEYGFTKTNLTSPFQDEDGMIKSGHPDYFISMKYFVTCNEDFVIYFLVKNNIPFKASCHYGHEYVSYKKDSDFIVKGQNFGLAMDMYGDDYWPKFGEMEIPPYSELSVKKYLNEEKEWIDKNNLNKG